MEGEQVKLSFKRGQVIAALWYVYAGQPRLGELSSAPKQFTRRVSKLIELGIPFGDCERPGRPGVDLEFSLLHAIELGIALDLQDVGLNQLEIARWLLFYWDQLRAHFSDLTRNLDTPKFLLVRGRTLEARNPFEDSPPAAWFKLTIGEPLIISREAVCEELRKLGGQDRSRIVIELTDLVRALLAGLLRAPVRRRGRQ
jgi:hypothetical protein